MSKTKTQVPPVELTERQIHAIVMHVRDNYYGFIEEFSNAAAEMADIDDDCDDETCMHMKVQGVVEKVLEEMLETRWTSLLKKYGDDYVEIVPF